MPKTEEELMPPPEAIPNVQHHRRALPKLNKPSAAITDGKSKYFYFLSAPWFLCKTHLPPFYSIQICTRVWNWLNGAAWKTSVARKSNSKCQIFSNEERYVVLALLINVHCRVKIIGLHQNVFVTGGGKTFLRIFTNKNSSIFCHLKPFPFVYRIRKTLDLHPTRIHPCHLNPETSVKVNPFCLNLHCTTPIQSPAVAVTFEETFSLTVWALPAPTPDYKRNHTVWITTNYPPTTTAISHMKDTCPLCKRLTDTLGSMKPPSMPPDSV